MTWIRWIGLDKGLGHVTEIGWISLDKALNHTTFNENLLIQLSNTNLHMINNPATDSAKTIDNAERLFKQPDYELNSR